MLRWPPEPGTGAACPARTGYGISTRRADPVRAAASPLQQRDALFMLLSSRLPLPDSHFDGYAWLDADLVSGAGGAAAWTRSRGRSLPAGEDGCYVTLWREGATAWAGTDHVGSRQLFLYRHGADWVLSDSLAGLIAHLGGTGQPMTLDPVQLHARSGHGPFTDQLTSFRTVVREIELVPAWCQVRLDAAGAELVPRPRNPAGPGREAYAAALSRFLETWTARFLTLLENPGQHLSADVSGGLDSRSVLAFLLHLDARPAGLTFFTSDKPHLAADRQVAEDLGRRFGFTPAHQSGNLRLRLTGAQGFQRWKTRSLGTYSPIRAFLSDLNPLSVKAGGGGGEMTRPFYDPKGSIPQYLARLARRMSFPEPRQAADWAAAVQEGLDRLVLRDGGRTDPLILHYRAFRTRFHTGMRTNQHVTAMPLQSRLLAEAAEAASPAMIAGRQIVYDIMHNLKPGLLDAGFAKPESTPTAANRAALTQVELRPPAAGRVFGAAEAPDGTAPDGGDEGSFLHRVGREFARAAPDARRFLPAARIGKAREAMRAALDRQGFERAKDGAPVHLVLLAAELARQGCAEG